MVVSRPDKKQPAYRTRTCAEGVSIRSAVLALPVSKVHFMVNREGGQERGVIYALEDVSKELFAGRIQPLLRPGYAHTAAQYRAPPRRRRPDA